MLLESRLEELVADGDRRDAAELATAALKNDEVVDVSVDGDTVTVETQRFEGTHDVRRDRDPRVVQQGEYRVKGDISFTFTTATMHDDALAAVRDELATDDPDHADAAGDADGGGDADATAAAGDTATADAATDGGEPEPDRDGWLDRLAARVRRLVGR